MSITPFNTDPADGKMILKTKPDGGLPDPQVWKFGATACPPGAEFKTTSGLTHDFDFGRAFIFDALKKSDIKSEGRDCFTQNWNVTVSTNDQLWDTTHTDGTPATATYPIQSSWGESATISLQIFLQGTNPTPAMVSAALGDDVLRAICWQESGWKQFYDDSGLPKKNANNNGTIDWGIMQINQGTNRQAWHWPDNISAGKAIYASKMSAAKTYLDQHGNYDQNMLNHEAVQRYNGGVYYKWNGSKWVPATTNGYADKIFQILEQKPWPQSRA